MARHAAAAYDAGDYLRAMQLYADAAQSDPTSPAYLYGAARAAHLAGDLDKAEAFYNRYLALGGDDPARLAKARERLGEVRGLRADRRFADAAAAARSENWPLAAQLYLEAWQLAPDRVALLFQSAVAAERAGLDADATARLRDYLDRAPVDAPDRAQARLRLDQKRANGPAKAPGAARVAPPAVSPGPTVQASAPGVGVAGAAGGISDRAAPAAVGSSRTLAWSVLAAGAAVGAAGGGVLAWAAWRRADLEVELARDPDTQKIDGIAYDDAVRRAADIHTLRVRGGIVAATGVVGAAVGFWLLTRPAPSAAAVTVAPDAVFVILDLAKVLR